MFSCRFVYFLFQFPYIIQIFNIFNWDIWLFLSLGALFLLSIIRLYCLRAIIFVEWVKFAVTKLFYILLFLFFCKVFPSILWKHRKHHSVLLPKLMIINLLHCVIVYIRILWRSLIVFCWEFFSFVVMFVRAFFFVAIQ